MEHYRSTFAVTGIAVLGLVVAAGILHPGNFERSQRASAPRAGVPAAVAWVDPPATSNAVRRRTAGASDLAALMKAEPAAVLPADGVMVQPLPATFTQIAATARRTGTSRHRKAAQRPQSTRQAALDRRTLPEPTGAPQDAAESGNAKADPIGDLIRGLGLGSNG